ncbi:MAG: 2-nonaprenyl-3-methyl-6-methoxy-1,4-benzoquinol hydroxylase [Alphaproteobacteria bacterium MarineAlpha5_Bin11]|nr:demethoxyubiquinone hydroxylase family protein [Pelagibacteraceae bacterium]MBI29481.1 demethoxyubiquinone hydroxylase family protein [Pelagibacteraceae bacterium]PPR44121.1 MAG: 2-nonaprenyl-3-methyl-6-methoxy-1,4-benzoquinol hydroxylase [Alphaproteobacteria bacterium MarineAlpha5_Bin11]PPR51391.1 MAG: 2-nonaprenyl-3-methyl-6-methoxy-1,4-benzoquinol hydroxylase [Alphaproteobacteria bacterium MarineAlpha5_Bin10]|tara:strand:+ start:1058 stop:1600 length:543 start_codon:yes stop_codon:yes gene_type:complete
MINKKSKNLSNKKMIEEIIRVDHAGEYGATKIYAGQLAIFGEESETGKQIKNMADQEQEHIETFNRLMVEKRVRPTALMPVWNIAGYLLGVSTALMGKKAAMACTVAVEDVIGKHYEKQAKALGRKDPKLKKIILKFRDDELEHHDIGIENDAEKAIGYTLLSKIIKSGCKTAIAISKKI